MVFQYLITGLAGLAVGIAVMRVWRTQVPIATGTAKPKPPAAVDSASLGRTRVLLYASAAIVAGAVGYIILRPAGDETTPVIAPTTVGQTSGIADVDSMITRLADRLKSNPADGEGFRMLGWSYVMTGRPQQALAPYKRALELLPKNPAVHAGYGEALVGVTGGKVTPEAKAEFDKAHTLDAKEPRSRYFLAMWLAQHGSKREALDRWIALANEGPADAQWQPDLHNQITKTADELGVDVAGRLKAPSPAAPSVAAPQITQADVSAATALPADQQQAMINGMVDGLAAKLKSNPGDAEGWARLLRSRMVLKQPEQAAKDLASARAALAGNAAALKVVNQAASQYGVPDPG